MIIDITCALFYYIGYEKVYKYFIHGDIFGYYGFKAYIDRKV